jgi:hypothetical protein
MEERDVGATGPDAGIVLRLDRAEVDLLRSALRYLEATLGREEADELKQVQDLEARLDRAAREGRG